MPECKIRGMLPTWQQAERLSKLDQEGGEESESRYLRTDKVERRERGGGMIDMLKARSRSDSKSSVSRQTGCLTTTL
jgi:hypothetical protein